MEERVNSRSRGVGTDRAEEHTGRDVNLPSFPPIFQCLERNTKEEAYI
jgi:hypothetical protein